jgi:copper chaperone
MNNKEILLDVVGMTCPSCVRHVNAALAGVEGVTKVDVRLREGRVLIQYDSDVVNVNELQEALGEAGYESATSSAA